MSSASTPDIGMFMCIPISRCFLYRLLDLFPGLEASPLERERLERFPPGFNQVQVGGVGGLKDKLPARIGQIEEQHVDGSVHRQVIEYGVNSLHVFGDPLLQLLEKVDPVDQRSARVGGGEDLARPGLKRSEHVARLFSPAIINFLLGPTGWLGFRRLRIHESFAWRAFDGHRTHLIQTHRHTACGRRGVDGFDSPLFLAKSGSTRSPNHVSSCRQLRPSAMKISLMRLRFMRMPLTRYR